MVTSDTDEVRQVWDREAATFDDEPDHGLRDPVVRSAWLQALDRWLPSGGGRTVLDLGCGTGSLSVLLGSLGHDVTGVDISPLMLDRARVKSTAAGQANRFVVGDAAVPPFDSGQFDAVICRHVLWTLPNLPEVLQRWTDLLKPGGRLLLIEGFWFTGAGLHAEEIKAALPASLTDIRVENLNDNRSLWGKAVTDERYVVSAARRNEKESN